MSSILDTYVHIWKKQNFNYTHNCYVGEEKDAKKKVQFKDDSDEDEIHQNGVHKRGANSQGK